MNQLWFGLGCDWFWWVYLWVKLLSLFPWPSILWRQCQKTLSTHLWDVRGAVKNENKLECLTLWVIFSWTVFFPVFWKCQCFDKRRNYKVFFSPFSDVPGHLCLNWLYIVDRWMFVTLYLKVEHIWQAAAHILKCHWNSRQLLINFMDNLLFRKSVLII